MLLAFACAFGGSALAADQFGSADQAKAMLDRAVIAMKSDQTAALKQFNDEKNKEFRDRDLYVYCFDITNGKFTAFQSDMLLGSDIRELKLPPDDPIGKRAYDAVHDAPEGNVVSFEYSFPKPGTKVPAVKQTLEARVGKQACGVTYFK